MDEKNQIWKSGKQIVMHKLAEFPDRCILTNQPARGKRWSRTLYWHHPALYILLINPLVYIIVALIFLKRFALEVGISESALKQRKTHIVLSWAFGFIGATVAFLALAQLGLSDIFIAIGLIVAIVALFTGIRAANRIQIGKVDGDFIWLRGACDDYRNNFPEWSR